MPRIRSQEGILSAEWLIDNPHNAYSTVYQEPEMAETFVLVTIGLFPPEI